MSFPPGRAGRGRLASLRARIPLWYGAVLALCLLAYSLAIVLFFTRHVEAELHRQIHEDFELAARSLTLAPSGRAAWGGSGPPWSGVHEEPGGGHWLEVWGPGGERQLTDGTQAMIALGPSPDPEHLPHVPYKLPGVPVRVLVEPLSLQGRLFVVRVALSEAAAWEQVRALRLEVIGLSVAVLALGGLGGSWIARRALDPLARMAERAQRITAERLHERLPAESGSLELDQLASAFNQTLARLEGSFAQLRQFTADVSHELRTPLTALRTEGEVGLRGSRDAGAYREVIGSMLEEVDRITRLTDDLLALARTDAGEATLRLEAFDLGNLAREVAGHLSVLAEEREQALEVHAPEPVPMRGDRTVLRQAVVNLVVNAITYAPQKTLVRVGAGTAAGAAILEVADQGPGIAVEHRDRIFERFYRVDKSRSRELGGTGLGLSLVKWAAEAHGGRVELDTEVGRGSRFRLVLPVSAAGVS